jgi:photosystem I P700 chlorophyll a apoprotein A1
MGQACTSTTWLWNLHADAHDFRAQTSDLENISRRIFASHFGHLSLVFAWLSGMYFSGARFSNFEAWLHDPTRIRPSSQVAWVGLNQDVLNGDQGGGIAAIRITSGFFHLWRGAGILSEAQLFDTALIALVFAWFMLGAGWFHYHRSVPTLAWFNDVDSMLNHHLAGLLGLGSLAWAGHLVHVACPIDKCLDLGIDPLVAPLPHGYILNAGQFRDLTRSTQVEWHLTTSLQGNSSTTPIEFFGPTRYQWDSGHFH